MHILVEKMTLREMFPEWWCKTIFSIPENCNGDYNWLDFTIFEFIFSFVVILVIKWIIDCLFFILGQIIPDRTEVATKIYPSMLGKDLDIPKDDIEDLQGSDLEFDEDVFNLEEESTGMTISEEDFVEQIDKEIETYIQTGVRK